jgi:uncharacterized protein (TIGR03435 family)
MLQDMKLKALCISLLFLVCSVALAEQAPQFEVASIKPSAPMPMGEMRIRMGADAGMLRYSNVSLRDCIRVAYRVKDFQIDGPDWLGSTRFDITAKFPPGATEQQVPEMLQALLTERFKLTLHREPKERSVLALVPGKSGAKLKPAEVQTRETADSDGGRPRSMTMVMMDESGAHLKLAAATLGALAEAISHFTERPVVDMSGITGQYEFDLVFAPETMGGMRQMGPHPAGMDRPAPEETSEKAGSVYEAVERYGLKLEPRKAPLDQLTIDHIEKTPTEN